MPSIFTVVISATVTLRRRRLSRLTPVWRIQFYTVLSLVIGAFVQRSSGQLSFFDEVAAAHLVFLNFYSAWFCQGMCMHTGTSAPKPCSHGYRLSVGMFSIEIQWLALPFTLGAVFLDSRCYPSPVAIDSTSLNDLTWVAFFAYRVHGVGLLSALWAPIVIAVSVNALLQFGSTKLYSDDRAPKIMAIFAFILYWSMEVVGIELSLKANRRIDLSMSEDNTWGYGQVIMLY